MSKSLEKNLEPVRRASEDLAALSAKKKNAVLSRVSKLLHERANEILAANAKDLKALTGATSAFRDRLTLTPDRIGQMRESLRQVAELDDPVGETAESKTLANGLRVRRVRAPLGVIFMIFESRPNVALEAFSLAFKAGNAIILRGGKESRYTVSAIYKLITEALTAEKVPASALWGITDPDRAIVLELLQQKQFIDVVVPRGGESLIEFVTKNSVIPIIKNDRGMCHVYIDKAADLAMALKVVVNAKCSRPGVCNAMETLLLHKAIAPAFLKQALPGLASAGVEIYGCPKTRQIGGKAIKPATKTSFDTEYLDLKMNCRVVDSLDDALSHIRQHGSRHSEAIITKDEAAARKFQSHVDAAAVYWNASTRFTDGFELGLGGELGISTQKLHARGPVGLRELTSLRWVIEGEGQIR